jgi:hypothetical protein
MEIIMSSSDVPATTPTIRSAADLACAAPYFVGFHPGDGSLVVIAFGHARGVFAARADLPDSGAPAAKVGGIADYLIPVVRQQQPDSEVVLIGYGYARHVDPALRIVERIFTAAGIPIRDLLRVTGSRVFPITCGDPACCPPDCIPFDPAASPVAVQATVAGLVAFPDRAAVAARFAPVDGAARERMREATRRGSSGWGRCLTPDTPPSARPGQTRSTKRCVSTTPASASPTTRWPGSPCN